MANGNRYSPSSRVIPEHGQVTVTYSATFDKECCSFSYKANILEKNIGFTDESGNFYPAGTKVSYGGTYTTTGKTRMGVLPYGYADGFLRSLSSKAIVMTEEGPARQCGRICMDMCMIDLTDKPGVGVASEVEIFGKRNPIEALAEAGGTIPYELVCAVSKRVPRMYLKDGEVIEKELLLRF